MGCGYNSVTALLAKRQAEQKQNLNEAVIFRETALPQSRSSYNSGISLLEYSVGQSP